MQLPGQLQVPMCSFQQVKVPGWVGELRVKDGRTQHRRQPRNHSPGWLRQWYSKQRGDHYILTELGTGSKRLLTDGFNRRIVDFRLECFGQPTS